MKINGWGFVLGTLVLGVALMLGMWNFRSPPSTLEVRGLAERIIPSNLAVYRFSFYVSENTFAGAKKKDQDSKAKVMAWLKKNGIEDKEFNVKSIVGVARDHNSEDTTFTVKNTVIVSSTDVQKIKKLEEQSYTLIEQDVMLGTGAEYGDQGGLQYELRNLDELRPGMLEDANKSAERMAKKFAADLNVKLGPVQRIDQGPFEAIDDVAGAWNKKVRVVTHVLYTIR